MKKHISFIAVALLFLSSCLVLVPSVHAATLTDPSVQESSVKPADTAVTNDIDFTTATSSTLTEIDFQYATASGGSTKPAGLDLTGTSIGSLTGLGSGWSLDSSSASSGLLKLVNSGGENIASATAITVPVNNVTNPSIGDCDGSATYEDTCYVNIITYDTGSAVDTATALYTVQDDASMTFTVQGVNSGVTTNGVTTTSATTYNTVPFGDVVPGQLFYAAQQLSVTANAPNGYSVYMTVTSQLGGIYSSTYISPFLATGASWSNPVAWSEPTGTVSGTNTGWIGANTSDTRVPDWSSASAKFAPANNVAGNVVMYDTGADLGGTNAYVTYAFEVNVYQIPDSYSGIINYTVVPNY